MFNYDISKVEVNEILKQVNRPTYNEVEKLAKVWGGNKLMEKQEENLILQIKELTEKKGGSINADHLKY